MEVNRLVFKNFKLKQYPSCVMVLLKQTTWFDGFLASKNVNIQLTCINFGKFSQKQYCRPATTLQKSGFRRANYFILPKTHLLNKTPKLLMQLEMAPASKYKPSLYLPFRKVRLREKKIHEEAIIAVSVQSSESDTGLYNPSIRSSHFCIDRNTDQFEGDFIQGKRFVSRIQILIASSKENCDDFSSGKLCNGVALSGTFLAEYHCPPLCVIFKITYIIVGLNKPATS